MKRQRKLPTVNDVAPWLGMLAIGVVVAAFANLFFAFGADVWVGAINRYNHTPTIEDIAHNCMQWDFQANTPFCKTILEKYKVSK